MTVDNLEPDRSRELSEYENHLRQFIAGIAEKSGVPGIVLEIAANGQRVSVATGVTSLATPKPMARTSRFHLGAIGSILLSLLILESAKAGKIGLREKIHVYAPELRGNKVGERIEIWHLLSHTAGFQSLGPNDRDTTRDYSTDRLIEFLKKADFLFEPGTVFSHTSICTALLAEIFHRVENRSARSATKELLSDRLGIHCTPPVPIPTQEIHYVGAHRYQSSLRKYVPAPTLELAEFWNDSLLHFALGISDVVTIFETIAHARASESETTLLVSKQVAWELQKQLCALPQTTGGTSAERLPTSVGLANAEYLPNWLGTNGPASGQYVSVRYHKNHATCVAVGLNAHDPSVSDAIMCEVIRSLAGNVQTPTPLSAQRSLTADELVGHYAGPVGCFVRVVNRRNQLLCELDGGGASLHVVMELSSDKRWILNSIAIPLSFGFFRDPISSDPCLMVGTTSYKKISAQ